VVPAVVTIEALGTQLVLGRPLPKKPSCGLENAGQCHHAAIRELKDEGVPLVPDEHDVARFSGDIVLEGVGELSALRHVDSVEVQVEAVEVAGSEG
jgi:hypothetical protein